MFSALPPTTDIDRQCWQVCFAPITPADRAVAQREFSRTARPWRAIILNIENMGLSLGGLWHEAPRFHHVSRRRGGIAARGARAAGGNAGGRIPQQLIA